MRLLILTILLTWAAAGWAEQVVNIYRGEVLVTSQSAAERQAATRQAFEDLVLRVSGDPHTVEHEQVRDAIERAQDYVYEFNYSSTQETLEVDGARVPAVRLVLMFSPVAVENLLRSAGLPLWPANRPSVLAWLVTDDGNGPTQIVEDELRQTLREHAQRRGLPLILPLQDLEGRLALSARELWYMDEAAVQHASGRYSPNAILVGRYSQPSSGAVRSNWQLLHSQGDPAFTIKDRKSTRLNSSHVAISYAVFCLKKKTK